MHDEAGAVVAAFRVAEDRSPADVDDEPYALPGDARVGVAHPVLLGDDLAGWAEVFADYEILQPFAQLGRDVHRLTEEERAATRLTRFEGRSVPTGRWLGLESRGWRRGAPQDAGVQGWIERVTPDGRTVVVDVEPGFAIGSHDVFPEQRVERVQVFPSGVSGRYGRGGVAFGDLDPVTASEVVRDLTEVTR